MAKSKSIVILVGLLLAVVGIFYYQYCFYRTPVAVTTPDIEEQIISGGPPLNGIPAINESKFESVFAADQYLDDNGAGIVVEQGGRHRFYPFQILVWHMIVNDVFNGKPLLITYDPLSESTVVFDRTIDETPLTFEVSGKLYNSNLLIADSKSGSLWSQLTGQAVLGEKIEQKLSTIPSFITGWENFKQNYPNGQVLSRYTGAVRDYTQNPYAEYQTSYATWFPVSHHDDRLDAKAVVFGYDAGIVQKAYPKELVREKGEIKDDIGGKQIVVYWDSELETVRGYTSIDEQSIVLTPSYWFVWAAMFPETIL